MILWTKTDFWPCVYAIFWRYFEKSRIFSRALVFCWHCKNVTSWPPFIKVKKFEQLFLLLRRSAAKKLRTNAIFTKFFFSLLKLSSSANMRDYNFRGKKWPNLQWHKHYVEKEKWGLAITFFSPSCVVSYWLYCAQCIENHQKYHISIFVKIILHFPKLFLIFWKLQKTL